MARNSQEYRIKLDNINLAFDDVSVDGKHRIINYLVGRFFEALENPTMFAEV